jgi:hypothetical protein
MDGAAERPVSIPKSPGAKSSPASHPASTRTSVSFMKSVDDITAEILAEAAVPEIAVTGADLQADRFDHARDLRKHEAV